MPMPCRPIARARRPRSRAMAAAISHGSARSRRWKATGSRKCWSSSSFPASSRRAPGIARRTTPRPSPCGTGRSRAISSWSRAFRRAEGEGHAMEHLTVAANGAAFHVARTGRGRPLLLLHGWPEFWLTWGAVMTRLADRFLLVAPDLRGFGDSDKPAGPFGPSDHAADMLALIDALALDEVGVVGHDVGGAVMQPLAGRIAMMKGEAPVLPPIATPTCVRWAQHDPLFPYEWTDRLGETFSDLDLALFPDVGHFPHREDPDRAAAEIAAFFSRIAWR